MKSYLLLLFLLISQIATQAQIGGEDEVYLGGDRIEPKFKGDDRLVAFQKFLRNEFDYSKVTKEGTMVFAFTIDENGDVKKIKVIEILDVESATEIIRVMKKCPKWEPAMRNGKPLSIEIKYPMVFNIKKKK